MLRRSIIVRTLLPLALMVVLVVTVGWLADGARRASRVAQGEIDAQVHVTLLLTDLRSVSRSLQRDALNLIVEPDPAERTAIEGRFDKRARQFSEELNELERSAAGRGLTDYFRTQRAVLTNLQTVRRSAGASRSRALDVFRTRVRPAERHASVIADALIERGVARDSTLRDVAVTAERSRTRSTLMLSALLSLAALGFGLYLMLVTVLRPLRAIRTAMEQLAAGQADRAIPEIGRSDEIGAMARSIAVFRDATRERDALREQGELARRERAERDRAALDAQHRLDAAARQQEALEEQRRALLRSLATAVDESVSAVNAKLRASADRLSRSATDVAGHAESTSADADATLTAARTAARELAAAAGGARQLIDSVHDQRGRAAEAAGAVEVAVGRSRSATGRIATLAGYADRVGEIMRSIREVAKQSQMLSLNASIEAARAGASGEGFAVVAGEMRKLAGQTADAAAHVEREVEAIRAIGGDGIDALAEIEDAVAQVERNAALLARSMTEQSNASDEIARAMQSALGNVERVGDRMTALGETAEGTRGVAGTLLADADALAEDAARVDLALRDLIGRLANA